MPYLIHILTNWGMWHESSTCKLTIFQESKPMTAVADILKSKAEAVVHSIEPTASVFEALQRMADKRIGALLVMEGEEIVGIVTERDYARKNCSFGTHLGANAGARRHDDIGDVCQTCTDQRRMHGADD